MKKTFRFLVNNIVILFILVFYFTITSLPPCFASMNLYISYDCENCDLVMRVAKKAIERLKDKGELEVIDVTHSKTDLSALPALVDGGKVIIGTGLLEYLGDKAGIKIAEDDLKMLDDCPDCD